MQFCSAPAEFEHHRNTNKHPAWQKSTRSQTSFSIKLPLSILFDELANFTFATFTQGGTTRCCAPFWTRHAVDRSVVLEMVRWTHLALSAWTIPKLLKVALQKKMQNSIEQIDIQEDARRYDSQLEQRSKDPNHSKSRSLQLRLQPGLQLHSLFGAKRLGVITSWLLVRSKPFAKVGARTCQNHPSMLTFGTTKQYQTAWSENVWGFM